MRQLIGIFDSGIGGAAIAGELKHALPGYRFLLVDDAAHAPYGTKSPAEITRLSEAAIQPLLEAGCDLIVVACNTATTVAITALRAKYPKTPFVGIEPMLKPAAQLTNSGTIAVCATPTTLASRRYQQLKRQFATDLTVLEPDCSRWAAMVEAKRVNQEQIKAVVDDVCRTGADVIVLGCTHYHWIKELITELAAGRAQVIEPSVAIAARVKSVLDRDL